MGIVYSSNGNRQESRQYVIDWIKEKKQENPDYRVLDVGGAHHAWADDVVDAYVDIRTFDTPKKTFIGDINTIELWDKVAQDGPFDFTICSHTLEDIRDPIFVIRQLQRHSNAGFIAMPNKHTEFSHPDTSYWMGFAHHRWVFTVKTDETGEAYLYFLPKWSSIEYFNRNKKTLAGLLGAQKWAPLLQKLLLRMGYQRKTKQIVGFVDVSSHRWGYNRLPWLREDLGNIRNQLAFIWEDDFRFDFVEVTNGTNNRILAYKEWLKEGL